MKRRTNPWLPRLLAAALALVAGVAQAGEKVQLRAGEHDGYARIAVEWSSPVTYDAAVEGTTLSLHFARPFTAPLGIIADHLDHYVASAAQSADGTRIEVKLRRPVTLKTMVVNRTTIAIDLVPATGKAEAEPAAKSSSQAAAAKLAGVNPAAAEPQAKDQPQGKDQAQDKAKSEVASESGALHALPQAAALGVVPPGMPEQSVTAKIPPPLPSPPPAASPPPKPVPPEAAASTPPGPVLAPLLVTTGDRPSLRFDWSQPTAAAVFRRGPALWIVFSARTKLDLDGLRAQSQGVLSGIDVVPAKQGTALRLIPADGLSPVVRRAGNSWIVDLQKDATTPDAPIAIDPRPEASQPLVELRVRDAGAPLRIKDPLVGDMLTVVPVAELGRGLDATRNFVDFRLLGSVQGIVIRANADDVVVQPRSETVEITRPGGLVLSNTQDRLLGGVPPERNRLYDFTAWRGPDTQSFIERRSLLDRSVAAVPPQARTQPRLDLARFYFANLFGPEALSVLAQVEHDDPEAMGNRDVIALKGGACFLARDYACAQQQLGQAIFDGESEAALWRGAIAARTADWTNAARQFERGIAVLPTYPKALRNRLALTAAEAMIETERGTSAGPLLDTVLKDAPNLSDRALAQYLLGRRELAGGQLEPALEAWVDVAGMGDRRARARALYARAMALYEVKKANRRDTINALDALRFSWRGDTFEFTLLRKLGELQLAEGDVDNGIEALHQAAVYFADFPAARDVAKGAADAFADLFLGQSATDVAPVKALALYSQFHDLEAPGERLDGIVKKLIDRLVGVDLLDQAAALLEEQVKTRWAGREKARGAAQLALVRLMNKQPEAALAALDLDVGSDVPPELLRQRTELRARALSDLGRAPEALQLLAGDNTTDGARLRADIYWRQHDWKNAASTLASLAGEPPVQGPLGPELSRLVLSWAAALTLAGDQDGIAKLRASFGPAIQGTQTAQAFSFITEDSAKAQSGGGTAADIAARVAEIGTLQSFISSYRQRLASGGLSAIN